MRGPTFKPELTHHNMAIEKSQIEAKLGEIIDPNTDADLVSGKAVKSIELEGNDCSVVIQLGYPAAG